MSNSNVELRQYTLTVEPVANYGRTEYRPSCEVSRMFCELLGQKGLSEKNIEVIKKMGFEFKIKEHKGGFL